MDQPKVERLLRLIQLLSSNVEYSIDDLMERTVLIDDLGSERVVKAYGNELDRVGNFIVRRSTTASFIVFGSRWRLAISSFSSRI